MRVSYFNKKSVKFVLLSILITVFLITSNLIVSAQEIDPGMMDILTRIYQDGLRQVIADETGVTEAINTVRAVHKYVSFMKKIENDMRNVEQMINNIEDDQLRKEAYVYFLLERKGHIYKYEDIQKLLYGGVDLGIEMVKKVVGGVSEKAQLFIEWAEAGHEALRKAAELGEDVDKIINERLVTDAHGKTRILTDAELSLLKNVPGNSIQEKYSNYYKEYMEVFNETTKKVEKEVAARTEEDEVDLLIKLENIKQTEPKVWNCIKEAYDWYEKAVKGLKDVDKLYKSVSSDGKVTYNKISWFNCGMGASWQFGADKHCCDEFDNNRRKPGAWEAFQKCGWEYEIKSRKEYLDKTIEDCRKRYSIKK